MKGHDVLFSSGNDNWYTPEHVYKDLNDEFNFDFDPCPLNPAIDGLTCEWGKRNFVNPPYSNIKQWMKRGHEEYLNGKTVVFLVPSRTCTKWWHDYAMKANEIRFIRGRLKFGGSKNSAPFPSCVVVFDGRKKELTIQEQRNSSGRIAGS